MTKDFKKFTLQAKDIDTTSLPRGIAAAVQKNVSEVCILWQEGLHTPDPVMAARALYVFCYFTKFDKRSLSVRTEPHRVFISRRDGLGLGEPYSPAQPETGIDTAETDVATEETGSAANETGSAEEETSPIAAGTEQSEVDMPKLSIAVPEASVKTE